MKTMLTAGIMSVMIYSCSVLVGSHYFKYNSVNSINNPWHYFGLMAKNRLPVWH